MSKYSLSYSSLADIYAIAEEETGTIKAKLLKLAEDLEQTGIGSFDGEEYIYRDSPYGMEVLDMTDYESEQEREELENETS